MKMCFFGMAALVVARVSRIAGRPAPPPAVLPVSPAEPAPLRVRRYPGPVPPEPFAVPEPYEW